MAIPVSSSASMNSCATRAADRTEIEAAGIAQRRLLFEVPARAAGPARGQRAGVGIDDLRRQQHRVRGRLAGQADAVFDLGAHHASDRHGFRLRERVPNGCSLRVHGVGESINGRATIRRRITCDSSWPEAAAGTALRVDLPAGVAQWAAGTCYLATSVDSAATTDGTSLTLLTSSTDGRTQWQASKQS